MFQINPRRLRLADIAFNSLVFLRFTHFWDLLCGISIILSTFWALFRHCKSAVKKTQDMKVLNQDRSNLADHLFVSILVLKFLSDLT